MEWEQCDGRGQEIQNFCCKSRDVDETCYIEHKMQIDIQHTSIQGNILTTQTHTHTHTFWFLNAEDFKTKQVWECGGDNQCTWMLKIACTAA